MPRTKTGTTRHKRHKKVLKRTKGFYGANSRLIKRAKEAQLHADSYAYVGRRLRKRDMRKLWIQRINAGLKQIDQKLSYSKFMGAMNKSEVQLNRKMLAQLAATDFEAFSNVVSTVQGK